MVKNRLVQVKAMLVKFAPCLFQDHKFEHVCGFFPAQGSKVLVTDRNIVLALRLTCTDDEGRWYFTFYSWSD